DGRPAFWTDIAVLALREPRRLPAHEFVFRLDPRGVHELAAVVLDPGEPRAPAALAGSMTPLREFGVAVSKGGLRDADFEEVLRGTLAPDGGPQRFELPAGTRGSHVRLQMLGGHDASRLRWTLAEFEVIDSAGRNLAASHRADQTRDGAL